MYIIFGTPCDPVYMRENWIHNVLVTFKNTMSMSDLNFWWKYYWSPPPLREKNTDQSKQHSPSSFPGESYLKEYIRAAGIATTEIWNLQPKLFWFAVFAILFYAFIKSLQDKKFAIKLLSGMATIFQCMLFNACDTTYPWVAEPPRQEEVLVQGGSRLQGAQRLWKIA